jgi:hypothetical protein
MTRKKIVPKSPARRRRCAKKIGAERKKPKVPQIRIAVWAASDLPLGVDSEVLIGRGHQPRPGGIIVDLNKIARLGGHAAKLPEFVEALRKLFGVEENYEMCAMLDVLNAVMFAAGRQARCGGCCGRCGGCSGKCHR